MIVSNKPKPEVHGRPNPEDINVADYDPLIYKFIHGYARTYGAIIVENIEDFYAVGLEGIMKAKKAYDPSRGTFVTIAYYKVFTEVSKLYRKLVKEYEHCDLSTEEQTEMHQRSVSDALGSAIGSSVDYSALGRILSVEDRQLYYCLLHNKTMTETCKELHISKEDYRERVATLKDTIIEHHRFINGII